MPTNIFTEKVFFSLTYFQTIIFSHSLLFNMNKRNSLTKLTISPLNSLENIEGQAWNLRRTCTFSEDNTESIKGFDGFSKEINYSPRMKLEDAITPQFKSIGNIYKDIESSTDDYIINDKSTDEHHSPAKQLNIIYASSFNKNYDSFN